MGRSGLFLWGCVFVLFLSGFGLFGAWISRTELPNLDPDVSVVVEARDGRLLRAFTVADGRWRLPVRSTEVSPGYLSQLIAFEDKRFYSHGGVDLRAMVRAVGQAVWHGQVVSGGSTLTMQVARLLEDSGTGRWAGKVRQMRVALALERQLTKDEILTIYLRLAPFGGNLEGVRAASLSYFQKETSRLTDAQAALLVALPQSPERRRPDRFPKRAKAARDRVLERSVSAGVLPQEALAAAQREPVPDTRRPFRFLAPHLSERVVAQHPAHLRHRLTIDLDIQSQAERLLKAHVAGRHRALSGAVMVVNHQTGGVLASVGAPDYLDVQKQGFVDMTRALRSPGSTLKPLIYGLAFEDGKAHPETVIDDSPIRFGPYAPQNFDNQFHGQIRVRDALQLSLNIPAVSLLDAVSPTVLMARMRRAGARPVLPNNQPPGLAIGLGGVGLRLQDLIAIYATLARGGQAVPLLWKEADEKPLPIGRPVISEVSAWYVSDILAGVVPPAGAIRKGVAYKTGTSYGHRDAWAIGYDGTHSIGVWLGRADGAAMPGKLGADLAAPLLFDVFAAIKPSLDPLPGPPRSALTVTNRELPLPLRVFRPPGVTMRRHAPEITFPRDGTRILLSGDPVLVAKVDRGQPPFTWLANGVPVEIGSYERQIELNTDGPGHLAISVIDSFGLSQSIRVFLE